MTFSLYITSITAAIANMSVTGVTIKDKDEIFIAANGLANTLIPNPNADGFITNFDIQYDSLLQGAEAPSTVSYTLNYRFLGVTIGDAASWSKAYSDIVDKLVLIVNAIVALPGPFSGRIEMKLSDVSIGAKEDPSGNLFHGADFALAITEMQN